MPDFAPATRVHGGHSAGWNPDSEADDTGERDRPLVHPRLPGPHLPGVCRVGLVLPVPEVEEERTKEEKIGMDPLEPVVGEHEKFAEELWQFPCEPL